MGDQEGTFFGRKFQITAMVFLKSYHFLIIPGFGKIFMKRRVLNPNFT